MCSHEDPRGWVSPDAAGDSWRSATRTTGPKSGGAHAIGCGGCVSGVATFV